MDTVLNSAKGLKFVQNAEIRSIHLKVVIRTIPGVFTARVTMLHHQGNAPSIRFRNKLLKYRLTTLSASMKLMTLSENGIVYQKAPAMQVFF